MRVMPPKGGPRSEGGLPVSQPCELFRARLYEKTGLIQRFPRLRFAQIKEKKSAKICEICGEKVFFAELEEDLRRRQIASRPSGAVPRNFVGADKNNVRRDRSERAGARLRHQRSLGRLGISRQRRAGTSTVACEVARERRRCRRNPRTRRSSTGQRIFI